MPDERPMPAATVYPSLLGGALGRVARDVALPLDRQPIRPAVAGRPGEPVRPDQLHEGVPSLASDPELRRAAGALALQRDERYSVEGVASR